MEAPDLPQRKKRPGKAREKLPTRDILRGKRLTTPPEACSLNIRSGRKEEFTVLASHYYPRTEGRRRPPKKTPPPPPSCPSPPLSDFEKCLFNDPSPKNPRKRFTRLGVGRGTSKRMMDQRSQIRRLRIDPVKEEKRRKRPRRVGRFAHPPSCN